MADDFVVVWDGRRNGPGGATLFVSEVQAGPPAPKVAPPRDAVVRVLATTGRATLNTIMEELGLGYSRDRVRDSLHQLRNQGRIRVVFGTSRHLVRTPTTFELVEP